MIFKQSEDRWDRFTFAPGFKQDVAMSRRNAPPVVLTLNKKHFEAVHAPQKTKFPRPWLLKTTKPLMIDLTGAGRGLPSLSATPSIHTWRTPVSSIPRRSSKPHPVQKSIRKVKVGSSVDQPWQGLMLSIRSLACRMLLTGDPTLRRSAAAWPEVHPLEFPLPWREPMPLPAAVLTNRLIVMPFFLLRFPLPMMPSNMQDDILSHLCKLGILLVPNETPEIA